VFLIQESKDVLLQRTQEERRQREVCGMNNGFSFIYRTLLSANGRKKFGMLFVVIQRSAQYEKEIVPVT